MTKKDEVTAVLLRGRQDVALLESTLKNRVAYLGRPYRNALAKYMTHEFWMNVLGGVIGAAMVVMVYEAYRHIVGHCG